MGVLTGVGYPAHINCTVQEETRFVAGRKPIINILRNRHPVPSLEDADTVGL